MIRKKTMLRLFFVSEIFVFGWFYYKGARGIQAVHALQRENEQIEARIAKAEKELHEIDQQIVAWNEYSFFTEKIAREDLHMAQAGEEIYYFD